MILTRPPLPALAAIHDRMPLILPGSAVADWINPAGDPAALLDRAVQELSARAV